MPALCLCLAISCTDDDPNEQAAVAKVIGPAGGTITMKGGASMEVPPGALSKDITFTIDRLSTPATLPFALLGDVYLITPAGTEFLKPVKVIVPYDATKLPAGKSQKDVTLATAQEQDGLWNELKGTAAAGKVTAEITHLSLFSPVIYGFMTWVKLPASHFYMGSTTSDKCRNTDETHHKVSFTQEKEIMASEVTQHQFLYRMGYNPSHFVKCGGTCPVENVNWHEAASYANAMSKAFGLENCYACQGSQKAVVCQVAAPFISSKTIYHCKGFRLPTEAEFEYAARATTVTSLYIGDLTNCTGSDALATKIAWYKATSGAKTHWAASRLLNLWRIADTSGNVAEWVNDWYAKDPGTPAAVDPPGPNAGSKRVLRGGSFASEPKDVRCAARASEDPLTRDKTIGFRLIRNKPPKPPDGGGDKDAGKKDAWDVEAGNKDTGGDAVDSGNQNQDTGPAKNEECKTAKLIATPSGSKKVQVTQDTKNAKQDFYLSKSGDLYYQISLPTGAYKFRLVPKGWKMTLWWLRDPLTCSYKQATAVETNGATKEFTLHVPTKDVKAFVVGSSTAGQGSFFDIFVEVPLPAPCQSGTPTNDTCAKPKVLSTGAFPVIEKAKDEGSCCGTNDVTGEGHFGPDLWYKASLSPGKYKVTVTTTTGWTPHTWVSMVGATACTSYLYGGQGSVTFTVSSTKDYIIAVDGNNFVSGNGCGPFELKIEKLP